MNQPSTINYSAASKLETNKVLRNTYALLSMTLFTSAIAAFFAVVAGIGHMASIGMMVAAMIIVFFVLPRSINSSMGLVWTFVFTTLMGASLGPLLSAYLQFPQGPAIVMQALGMTGLIFFGLSGYVLTTKKDFSFMSGFLMAGLIVVVVSMLLNLFLQIPMLSLAISGAAVMLFSGFILYDTSNILNGTETNYIRATISMYLNIFNIFVHLLHILGFLNDD
ncbi:MULTISPECIES: Bax inhibitor-1/YccA family protein [unclassified Agarivorans]|uniref:Bax inhibitor-1/YccA family protein n=1 Tax=unclassified Agarivorans TaxID=2636026 RepID=UPI0010DB2F4F|nr:MULTISPECIES: Bax inhibitor-1/YccA family protein [unclassified Agarivorans]MDO6684991.1 Bax inhibitor-1/YccA family protein [Agarivorans sp. 3_MG-2023]MDO6714848.1 Bax inhibitor-1/YccA family protein [Agarivorans sp. 2_MG-2023]MDO6765363.1 Bax inhibitor-1/YccA family protein [Agarivorans sp. 1_MG-2023]GDY27631.1 BAX inhibitor protein [Agarivorans sp. Toyoura001]